MLVLAFDDLINLIIFVQQCNIVFVDVVFRTSNPLPLGKPYQRFVCPLDPPHRSNLMTESCMEECIAEIQKLGSLVNERGYDKSISILGIVYIYISPRNKNRWIIIRLYFLDDLFQLLDGSILDDDKALFHNLTSTPS